MDDRFSSVPDRVVQADRADRDNDQVFLVRRELLDRGLASLDLRAHGGRCIRRVQHRVDPAEHRDVRGSRPAEHVLGLGLAQALERGQVDLPDRVVFCLALARRRERRVRLVRDSGVAGSDTRRAKKAR